VSSFSQLSKSKSSAAVLQDGVKKLSGSRSGQIKTVASTWNREKAAADEDRKVLAHHDVRTNQVKQNRIKKY
jgi:hypothetical protein